MGRIVGHLVVMFREVARENVFDFREAAPSSPKVEFPLVCAMQILVVHAGAGRSNLAQRFALRLVDRANNARRM